MRDPRAQGCAGGCYCLAATQAFTAQAWRGQKTAKQSKAEQSRACRAGAIPASCYPPALGLAPELRRLTQPFPIPPRPRPRPGEGIGRGPCSHLPSRRFQNLPISSQYSDDIGPLSAPSESRGAHVLTVRPPAFRDVCRERVSLMRLPHPRPGQGQPGCVLLQAWPPLAAAVAMAASARRPCGQVRLGLCLRPPGRAPAPAPPRFSRLPPHRLRLRWPRVRGRIADQRDLYLAFFPSNRFCWGWSWGRGVKWILRRKNLGQEVGNRKEIQV